MWRCWVARLEGPRRYTVIALPAYVVYRPREVGRATLKHSREPIQGGNVHGHYIVHNNSPTHTHNPKSAASAVMLHRPTSHSPAIGPGCAGPPLAVPTPAVLDHVPAQPLHPVQGGPAFAVDPQLCSTADPTQRTQYVCIVNITRHSASNKAHQPISSQESLRHWHVSARICVQGWHPDCLRHARYVIHQCMR